ncbi:sigma-E factor negative regulatory protein [Variovorax sp. HJSM1_2]|uniref:sigma-E factor negative regulatory protein n=1 Tax=Variovorax sp. HJSM1_2 TaxID=3366263 RepID=UPI003BE66AC5
MNTEQTKTQREMLSALMDGQLQGAAFAETLAHLADDKAAQADWHCYHLLGDVLRAPDLADCAGDAAFLSRFQARLAQEPRFDRPASLPEVTPQFAAELVVSSAAAPGVKSIFDAKSKAQTKVDKAANESSFRWKLVAGFASLAAVSAIGWNMLAVSAPALNGAQLALASDTFHASASPLVLASEVQGAGPVLVSTTFGAPESTLSLPYAEPASASVAGLPAGVTAQTVTLPSGEPQVMIRNPRLDALMAAHKQFGGASALQTPAPFLREATFESPEQ